MYLNFEYRRMGLFRWKYSYMRHFQISWRVDINLSNAHASDARASSAHASDARASSAHGSDAHALNAPNACAWRSYEIPYFKCCTLSSLSLFYLNRSKFALQLNLTINKEDSTKLLTIDNTSFNSMNPQMLQMDFNVPKIFHLETFLTVFSSIYIYIYLLRKVHVEFDPISSCFNRETHL